MKLDDRWIRENIGMLSPGSAKFILERISIGRIVLSRETVRLLEGRVGREAVGPATRPPDWAERAAGEREV